MLKKERMGICAILDMSGGKRRGAEINCNFASRTVLRLIARPVRSVFEIEQFEKHARGGVRSALSRPPKVNE
jgi:hypothetical protein